LELLKQTYTDKTTIIHTLSHFIDILDRKETVATDKENSPLIDSFKDFWTSEEIEVIYRLFLTLDQTNDKTYMTCIDEILASKELKTCEYVRQSSSSYTD